MFTLAMIVFAGFCIVASYYSFLLLIWALLEAFVNDNEVSLAVSPIIVGILYLLIQGILFAVVRI